MAKYKRNHDQIVVEHVFDVGSIREKLSKMTRDEFIDLRTNEYDVLLNRMVDDIILGKYDDVEYRAAELIGRKKGEEIFDDSK